MKKVLSVLLAAVMLVSILTALPFTASALNPSGSCGNNAKYTLYTATGELVISGTGPIADYENGDSPFTLNYDKIESIVIKEGISRIGVQAFLGCRFATSVSIPGSVKVLEFNAFWGCHALTSVVLPSGVTTIGTQAFNSCTSLKTITLPDTLSTIGARAFTYCNALTDVYYAGTKAQWNQISISDDNNGPFTAARKHLNYNGKCGDNVTYTFNYGTGALKIKGTGPMYDYAAGESPFYYETNITSVEIDRGVTAIGNCAFSTCTNLKNLIIAPTVTKIRFSAFSDCLSLKSVTIPSGVTIIDTQAFYRCSNMADIFLPITLTNVSPRAFSTCPSLKTVYYAGDESDWQAISISSDNNSALVNAQINYNSGSCGAGVNYFYDYDSRTLTIRGNGAMDDFTWTYPGYYAVKSYILKIDIGEGVTEIGGCAFTDCPALQQVILPETTTAIGYKAFKNCPQLSYINIPDSVTTIGEEAFKNAYDNMVITADCQHPLVGGLIKDTHRYWSKQHAKRTGTIENYVPATCSQAGSYDVYFRCAYCSEFIGLNPHQLPQKDHTPAATTKENVVAATCTQAGSYDEVVRCIDCKTVLSSGHKTEAAKGHTPGAPAKENVVAATCTKAGSYDEVVRCTVCQAVISSSHKTEAAKGHTPGKEEEIVLMEPDCISQGQYKLVVKCTVCQAVLSEKEEWTPAYGHSYKTIDVVKPTSVKAGYEKQKCSLCTVSRTVALAPTGVVKTISCKARTATAETITWSALKGAQGYQIQISNAAGNKWGKTYNAKTATSYTFKGLSAGGTYKFRVRIYAKGFDGNWVFGDWTKAVTSPTLPTATGISKFTMGKTAFTAQWKQNNSATGYQLQYSTSSKFAKAKNVNIKSNKTLKTTVKNLKSKTTYYVRFRTYKTVGKTNYFSGWKVYKVKTK